MNISELVLNLFKSKKVLSENVFDGILINNKQTAINLFESQLNSFMEQKIILDYKTNKYQIENFIINKHLLDMLILSISSHDINIITAIIIKIINKETMEIQNLIKNKTEIKMNEILKQYYWKIHYFKKIMKTYNNIVFENQINDISIILCYVNILVYECNNHMIDAINDIELYYESYTMIKYYITQMKRYEYFIDENKIPKFNLICPDKKFFIKLINYIHKNINSNLMDETDKNKLISKILMGKTIDANRYFIDLYKSKLTDRLKNKTSSIELEMLLLNQIIDDVSDQYWKMIIQIWDIKYSNILEKRIKKKIPKFLGTITQITTAAWDDNKIDTNIVLPNELQSYFTDIQSVCDNNDQITQFVYEECRSTIELQMNHKTYVFNMTIIQLAIIILLCKHNNLNAQLLYKMLKTKQLEDTLESLLELNLINLCNNNDYIINWDYKK